MPQLDITTFLSQIFWLLLFFWLFYFITFQTVVPLIVNALKMRVKRFSSIQLSSSELQKEVSSVSAKYDTFFSESCGSCYKLVQKSYSNVASWALKSSKQVSSQFKFTPNYLNNLVNSFIQLQLIKRV
nr:ATP synthase subunit 8 [Schizochytrium sp. TIO1101]